MKQSMQIRRRHSFNIHISETNKKIQSFERQFSNSTIRRILFEFEVVRKKLKSMENDFDQSVKDLLHYHKVGTDYIKKALLIDENSSK